MKFRGDLDLYRRVFQQARPHWGKIAVIFCLDLPVKPAGFTDSAALEIAVDRRDRLPTRFPGFCRTCCLQRFNIRAGVRWESQSACSSCSRSWRNCRAWRVRCFAHTPRKSSCWIFERGSSGTCSACRCRITTLSGPPIPFTASSTTRRAFNTSPSKG